MITRRSLFCAIAASAIVRACNLMPIKALEPADWLGGNMRWFSSFLPELGQARISIGDLSIQDPVTGIWTPLGAVSDLVIRVIR